MNELIKVGQTVIGEATIQTVSARDLHAKLEVKQDFNEWLRVQIERARLIEGKDYLPYQEVVQHPSGAKTLKQCALTLEASKHICVSKNAAY